MRGVAGDPQLLLRRGICSSAREIDTFACARALEVWDVCDPVRARPASCGGLHGRHSGAWCEPYVQYGLTPASRGTSGVTRLT
eukprot:4477287-Prymnesium_polylepis.2